MNKRGFKRQQKRLIGKNPKQPNTLKASKHSASREEISGMGGGSGTTYFIHDPMGVHSQQNPDGSWVNFVTDGLGSIRAVLDENLNVLESRDYDPFGNPLNQQGERQTPFGFAGEVEDPNGLIHLRARYLNPSIGTFLTPDPFIDMVDEPTPLNPYTYANNNPVNYVDPSGMFPNPYNQAPRVPSPYEIPHVPYSVTPRTGIPDPMAMLNWLKGMNSGCYQNIPPFTQNPAPPNQPFLQNQQSCSTNRDTRFSHYGVTLVGCWSNYNMANIETNLDAAFRDTGERLNDLTLIGGSPQGAFRAVFGGLEFTIDVAGTPRAQTVDGRNVAWGAAGLGELNNSMPAGNGRLPQHLVVHELGHVLQNRTAGQTMGGIVNAMYRVAENFRLPDTQSIPLSRASSSGLEERVADLFLFWVYVPSAFDQLPDWARVYIEGGTARIEVDRNTIEYPYSPGMTGWAWMATFF